jgi:hypothetical protein
MFLNTLEMMFCGLFINSLEQEMAGQLLTLTVE